LKLPSERAAALKAALEDKDERIAHLGLVAAQESCPASLIPLVAHFATNPRIPEEIRIKAINALARTRDQYALDTLTRLVQGGTTLFGRPKQVTPVIKATMRALEAVKAVGV